jgi:Ca2+-binding EF-hand superfamily protein
MAQSDPSIQAGKPISLKKLTEGFEKMRGQRDAGGRDSTDTRQAADDALMPELLVPGFGTEETPEPLLGFGATAEMLSVPVTADDQREADERMRRYDRNKDGFLTKDELSSRFSGNPMDFDRNRDGKISVSELAVRYARRREGEEQARSKKDDQRRDRRGDEKQAEVPDVYNQRQSYRVMTARQTPDGVPGFFVDKDANTDGQVTMAEFSSDWNDETLTKFFQSDLNRDGVITADEALRSVELGGASTMVSVASAMSPSSSSGQTSNTSSTVSPPPIVGGKPDPKYVKVVERIVTRYDKNKDNALTASEWGKMLMSPAAADTNRDGRITIDEYALWMQSRQKK